MSEKKSQGIVSVIAASSVGTLIEWYDFYIFGSLAFIISSKFFPSGNPTAAILSTLATFAAGFVVRPFGALFFGRLGDLIGRKYTFLVTLVLMGLSTFAIGLVPTYSQIGFFAPLLVLLLRLLQGLALGGEYGGAATYVAEHSPANQRGYWTSWIQTTATLGLFFSLLVIYFTKKIYGNEDFEADWGGWRVPFWISSIMVIISYFIRKNMSESPLFAKLKSEGTISKNPLKESFGNKLNFRFVLLALLGVTMGQGVIWYTGQFYALNYIQSICNVELGQASTLVATALLLATPFFVAFGSLSDKIGRKWIMLAGMLVGILSYRSIYDKMYEVTNVSHKTEIAANTKVENKAELAKKEGIITKDSLYTTTTTKEFADGTKLKTVEKATVLDDKIAKAIAPETKKTLTINDSDWWSLVWLVFIQVIFVTMVYGPVAAFLVELFPTKIRYTSMSLPYHIGNGIFGGLLPFIATSLVTAAKAANKAAEEAGLPAVYDKPHLEGLWYPIIIAAVCFVIGALYVRDNKRVED